MVSGGWAQEWGRVRSTGLPALFCTEVPDGAGGTHWQIGLPPCPSKKENGTVK